MTDAARQTIPPDDEFAIRVRNVSKHFVLWTNHAARVKEPLFQLAGALLSPFAPGLAARFRAKADSFSREFPALSEITLDIRKGEAWGFIGVNGSGKSTLLKIISGHFRPSAGTVEVDGKVSILEYSSGLHGEFTGRENVYLKAAILGLSRREIDEKMDDIEKFADIGEFFDQPVKTYSSGMQARLGFSIIAQIEADILITDEALAVGDAFFVQKCMSYIRGFIRKGTFLFVSHSIGDILALCDKAVWLEKGRIMAIGPAREVGEAYMARQVIEQSEAYEAGQAGSDAPPKAPTVAGETHEIVLRQPVLARKMDHAEPRIVHDPRMPFLNASNLRNDIEIPDFVAQTGYGVGGAKIVDASMMDEKGATRNWVIGSEVVRLLVTVEAGQALRSPIVGFQVRDRLGQTVIADNTYLITRQQPFVVEENARFCAEFCFQMPLLPVGDYTVRLTVASGVSDTSNAMLHAIEAGLLFRSITSGARHGLVGVPMQYIRMFAA